MRNTLDSKKLLGFVERIERLGTQIAELKADIKVVKSEAEREGYKGAGLALAVKVRAQKPSAFREAEDLRGLYLHAIGMAAEPPLFKMMESMVSDQMGRDAVIERMKELVPAGAQIVVHMDGPPIRLFRDKEGRAHAEEVREDNKQSSGAPSPLPERPKPDVPVCTAAEAEELGAADYRADKPITANPFPFGDKRQARWEKGWRGVAGSDGMGPAEPNEGREP